MKKIAEWELLDHGVDSQQCFPGCGTAFTEYDYCFTGVGFSAEEAFDDALDQIAYEGFGDDIKELEKEIKEYYGITEISAMPICTLTDCEFQERRHFGPDEDEQVCQECENYETCNDYHGGNCEMCDNCELGYYLSIRIKEK